MKNTEKENKSTPDNLVSDSEPKKSNETTAEDYVATEDAAAVEERLRQLGYI